MHKTIDEISEFLNWYREVYSTNLYFDGDIVDANKEVPSKQASVKPSFQKRVNKESIIEQFTPPLRDFYYQIKDCQNCPLGSTRKNFVFGIGNPHAKIMFVGEAPGRDEDEQGIPFVGRAGKLLDKMLWAIGLNRSDVFIANVLKCRPPQNRDPLPDEIANCEPYLKKQLEIISPKVLVALGRIAGQVLLRRDETLTTLRQETLLYEKTPFIVTYHPAALLRNPQWKQNAWEDFKKIKKVLKN